MASILLVEDDSSMRHFLHKALERAGHTVMVCANGLDALRVLVLTRDENQAPFDLLLTDIVMPGMDGIQLSQRALEISPGLKIMFMTGFSAIVMNRKEVSENVMLSKPFHLKELVERVDKLLAA
ncbi:MAG: response regulator [Rhodospirillales bacterium]|nr:response regulator [Rhodospirillales bacterium]MCB9964636.1 response regulator [Rhodospirillales bacterium]MCB9979926.1 response regulator [Rhodospirillales bacterium]